MLITILIFLAVLSVLVIAHEFGHFYAARKAGMTVHEFGLGFPPKIFSWTDKNGTEWSLNLIPLGGFVRIKGENADSEGADDEDSFSSKSKTARFIVLIAGVVMNFIVAAIFLGITLMFTTTTVLPDEKPFLANISNERTSIIHISPDSPLADSTISTGDTITAINNQEVLNAEQAINIIGNYAENEDIVNFTIVNSQGETLEVSASPIFNEELNRSVFGLAIEDLADINYPWWFAPIKGIELAAIYTWLIIVAFFGLIRDLILGSGVQEAVAGPVGIAQMTGEVARMGIINLMQFTALLSLNLAVLNALPIPALDGGRILFVLIEAIRGKKNSPQLEASIHGLGFLLLMILVVIITYRDIVNLL